MSFLFEWSQVLKHGFIFCHSVPCKNKFEDEIPAGFTYARFVMPNENHEKTFFYCEDCGKKMVESIINEHKFKSFK